jgi:hypothetical protein
MLNGNKPGNPGRVVIQIHLSLECSWNFVSNLRSKRINLMHLMPPPPLCVPQPQCLTFPLIHRPTISSNCLASNFSLPHYLAALLSRCPIVSLSNCLAVSLSSCITVPLLHRSTAHCLNVSRPHFLTVPLPNWPTA